VLKKVRTIDQIIVVDDGSCDGTARVAKSMDVEVVSHPTNRGKGAAIKTGIQHARGDILLFLDADLQSIKPCKITSILHPLQHDEADFVKTSFSRARGRVTELVVKPLLRVTLPFISFSQPLSGQFAIRKSLVEKLEIDDKWGVDIQILLKMVCQGVRITEVDIGYLTHKKQPFENLTVMSEQVIRTILSEIGVIANNHKLVIFDFDKTLICESSIEIVADELGFTEKLKALRAKYVAGKIKDRDITLGLARLFKGKRREDLEPACRRLHLSRNAEKVVGRLKKRQYNVAVISLAFDPVVEYVAEQLGIDKENVLCPRLAIDADGRYTGQVLSPTSVVSDCCDHLFCKGEAALELIRRFDLKPEQCIGVGDGKSDECLFRVVGLALGYKTKRHGDIYVSALAEVLVHAD